MIHHGTRALKRKRPKSKSIMTFWYAEGDYGTRRYFQGGRTQVTTYLDWNSPAETFTIKLLARSPVLTLGKKQAIWKCAQYPFYLQGNRTQVQYYLQRWGLEQPPVQTSDPVIYLGSAIPELIETCRLTESLITSCLSKVLD